MNTIPIEVTLFSDRALITRRGKVNVQSGVQTIRIENLPLHLLTESVRVSGRGNARAVLLGVQVERQFFAVTPASNAQQLEQQLEQEQENLLALQQQEQVLKKEGEYLQQLGNQGEVYARALSLRERTPAQQAELFDFVRQRLLGLSQLQLKMQRQQRASEREIKRLQAELRQVQAQRPTERNTVVVELSAQQAGDLELDIKYILPDASWQPLYDIRYTPENLQVAYLAEVRQNSGEDWQGVKMTLSTANLSQGISEIPELDPWYVHLRPIAPPPMPKRAMLQRSAMPMMAENVGAVSADAAPEMVMNSASVENAGLSVQYQLAGDIQLAGNNTARKLSIADVGVKARLDFVTAPIHSEQVVRRLSIENTSGLTLLPGMAQLFANDEFLGRTALELVVNGQSFELALGVDEQIRVERKLAQRKVEKTLLSGRRKIVYTYTIEMQNLYQQTQTVLVREHLPHPMEESIKCNLLSITPEASEKSELSLLEWKLSLSGGAKQTVQYSYAVEYPADREIVGLP
ncbi:MAG TPA: mucoidy inhibitor MuiA family protein [Anaerolineales bacterium]|nr:mucoidy inhibitor MuiA family protein [Anaerolineales bacterium]